MEHLIPLTSAKAQAFINRRDGETRIGERCHYFDPSKPLNQQKGAYAILGIPEDIGVRANNGRGGTQGAWNATLPRLLNLQSNRFLDGGEMIIIGEVDCIDLMKASEGKTGAELYALVEQLDERVAKIAYDVTMAGKTLVVVGGGHNNAYPIIKGVANGLYDSGVNPLETINCVNLDPHADLRIAEGRHSGNGFTYARDYGALLRYAVIGLHENANNEHILTQLEEQEDYIFNTYESYVRGEKTFEVLLSEALGFVADEWRGIEIDLDAISNVPSSAMTPSGISAKQARQFVSFAGRMERSAYLHITEGAPALASNGDEVVGKLIATLIMDFVKVNKERITWIDMEYEWLLG